MGLMPVDYS